MAYCQGIKVGQRQTKTDKLGQNPTAKIIDMGDASLWLSKRVYMKPPGK